jgi:hypothetical protein
MAAPALAVLCGAREAQQATTLNYQRNAKQLKLKVLAALSAIKFNLIPIT